MSLTLHPIPVSNESPEEIYRKYIRAGRPVIIESVARQWPALSKWTPEFLERTYGDLMVPVFDHSFETAGKNYLGSTGKMPFRDYLRRIMAGPTPLRLFLFQLLDAAPELREDVPPPQGLGKINSRHIFLFFGGPGASPPTHYDVDMPNVFHTVIHGARRILLFAPEQSRNLYKHPFTVRSYVDFEKPDYERYPRLRNAEGYDCVLEPGQTLFIPSGYWHKIYYLTGGYAISFRQYLPQRIPLGLYNLLVQESIDKLFNKLAPEKWDAWKRRRAERR
jgi:hypothetical protein